MINIDITLLIQVVNFLIALAIINYLIIRPVRGIMARRRAQNDELRGAADSQKRFMQQPHADGPEAQALTLRSAGRAPDPHT